MTVLWTVFSHRAHCPNHRATPYFNAVASDCSFATRLMPSAWMISMIASAIPAAIRPYSIAVAPDSSARNSAHLRSGRIRSRWRRIHRRGIRPICISTSQSRPSQLCRNAGKREMHHHNPRLSKSDRFKLTTMNAAFARGPLQNDSGTRVAAWQHPHEKPVFADLRHCAATRSSEQSRRCVPFRARLFLHHDCSDRACPNRTVWRQGS